MRRRFVLWGSLVLAALLFWNFGRSGPVPGRLRAPPGFRVEVWAEDVDDARSLALGAGGTVFVGTREAGNVYAVRDEDGDGRADRVRTIATGLEMPNGVAIRDGALYVAEVSRIIRFDDIEARLDSPPAPAVVFDRYPTEGHHGWKHIAFGPDGMLYVPVGAPCNICSPADTFFATITRLRIDGAGVADDSGARIFARGVRNSVGFDWHPESGELWFTDNGRDWMGDNRPPDELNRAGGVGLHFGFPHCHGRDIADPEFGDAQPCSRSQPPEAEFGAHVAALGIHFYRGAMFPAEYRGQAFVAHHGSWNRSSPSGYQLVLVRFRDGRPVGTEEFVTGWRSRYRTRGRPVALLELPDGSLLVSDDHAGAIYRITWEGS